MGLLDKANKRKCYPVPLEDRTVYVRSLKNSEIRRMNAITDKDLRTPFAVGICLVSEAGVPEAVKSEKESDEDFAKRMDQSLDDADVDSEMIVKVMKAVGKIGSVDVKELEKNLPATAKPDSPAD